MRKLATLKVEDLKQRWQELDSKGTKAEIVQCLTNCKGNVLNHISTKHRQCILQHIHKDKL